MAALNSLSCLNVGKKLRLNPTQNCTLQVKMRHLAADKQQQRHAGNRGQGAFLRRERHISNKVVMQDLSIHVR